MFPIHIPLGACIMQNNFSFQNYNGYLSLSLLIFMPGYSVWLGFQRGSEHMLQSLYLMCKAKHHKSLKHSSVFSNGSLNQSEDEKADTSPRLRVQNGSYLALDSSDSFGSFIKLRVLLQDCGQREIFSCSLPVHNVCLFFGSFCVWVHTQCSLYIFMTNVFIPISRWGVVRNV